MSEFYFDPVAEDILCVHRKSKNYHNIYHKHDGYEVYLLLNGNVNIYVDQSCYHIARGSLCFFGPDQLHLANCLDDSVYERLTVNIKPEVISRIPTEQTDLLQCFAKRADGKHTLGLLTEQQIGEFLDLFQKLKASAGQKAYGSDVRTYSALSMLLLLANQSMREHPQEKENIMPELISDMMNFVEEHIATPLSLDMFAEHFYMNGKYLSRRFHEEMGITLQQYILSKRIMQAKHLLQQNTTVTETCYLCGFGSYANFIRTFTSRVGISPGKYKKLNHTPA